MPIYKQKGTKNGLQRYRVVVSYTTQNVEKYLLAVCNNIKRGFR